MTTEQLVYNHQNQSTQIPDGRLPGLVKDDRVLQWPQPCFYFGRVFLLPLFHINHLLRRDSETQRSNRSEPSLTCFPAVSLLPPVSVRRGRTLNPPKAKLQLTSKHIHCVVNLLLSNQENTAWFLSPWEPHLRAILRWMSQNDYPQFLTLNLHLV